MRKTKLSFAYLFLFVTILFSCSQEEEIISVGSSDSSNYSEFRITEQEVASNVTEFLNDFYSNTSPTKGIDATSNKPKIKNISILTKKDLPQMVQTRSSAEGIRVDSLLYFVNLDEGFIIAGADKRTMPVFAFIDAGSFTKETLKDNNINNLPFLGYIERTLYVVNEDMKDNILYSENSSSTRAYPIKERIYPLLGQTKWDQSRNPYNLYTPSVTTHAGCVMAALAQVSSYYKSPKSVYYGDNISENPIGKGFTLNLNWANILAASNSYGGAMPPTYYSWTETTSYNESQAVGLYMRYIGKMLNATYASDGTSASFDGAIGFMRNIIGLQATDKHQFNRTNLYTQIRGGNLVVLCGYANSTGGLFPDRDNGHMWLADGVFVCHHNHQYFHYNWGWGGDHNGFFFEDRWNPGKSEFDDAGNEVPQGDYGKDFKYGLKCSYISW